MLSKPTMDSKNRKISVRQYEETLTFILTLRTCQTFFSTSNISMLSLISCSVLPKKPPNAQMHSSLTVQALKQCLLSFMAGIYVHLSSRTWYFSTEQRRCLPEKPPKTYTLPLHIVIACAFLLSFIGALLVISFFMVRYSRASFLGGDPPPVIKISYAFKAIAAEHWQNLCD